MWVGLGVGESGGERRASLNEASLYVDPVRD